MEKLLTSGPTRVASAVFFVTGFFTFTDGIKNLKSLPPNQGEMRNIYIFLLLWSIVAIITSNYLSKGKKWSYISASTLTVALFGLNAYLYFYYGSIDVINLAVLVVTIFLLILGRKDFANK